MQTRPDWGSSPKVGTLPGSQEGSHPRRMASLSLAPSERGRTRGRISTGFPHSLSLAGLSGSQPWRDGGRGGGLSDIRCPQHLREVYNRSSLVWEERSVWFKGVEWSCRTANFLFQESPCISSFCARSKVFSWHRYNTCTWP